MNHPAIEESRIAAILLKKHELPPLPYAYTALEPAIDARTMTLHHDNHHKTYVEKLNAALEKFPDFRQYSALWLLRNLDKVPKEIRTAVQQNAGGHVNHNLFWRAMKPASPGNAGAQGEPKGLLRDAINRDFGSFTAFKTQFEEAGAKLFGAGWVWLVRTLQDGGKLEVITTSGHDHPLVQHHYPLLLNDVWEHAYYLHYESRRADYLKAWWPLVDWERAAHCFEISGHSAAQRREAEGGDLLAA